jgi:hypothetical protein
MFSTITSKYAGTCRRCGSSFPAGTRIRYGGRGRTYHLKTDCASASASDGRPYAADDAFRDDDDRDRNGSYYTRFSSGAEVFTNKNGRCEDAPCCGCCS